MPLGTVVGLSPDHIVLDGVSSRSPKRALQPPPHFYATVYSAQMAGWIKMPLGTEVCLGPGDIVLNGDPASPPQKGTKRDAAAPTFWPMSVVAKRSPISATAELLSLPHAGSVFGAVSLFFLFVYEISLGKH